MNKKGQSLVLFVVFLPILIIIFAFIFDISIMITEKVRLQNIAEDTIYYLIEKDKPIDVIENYIKANDEEIKILKLGYNEVHLKTTVESYFGKVIGFDNYQLEVYLVGSNIDGKLRIKEKGK